jgi:hypothetical protein
MHIWTCRALTSCGSGRSRGSTPRHPALAPARQAAAAAAGPAAAVAHTDRHHIGPPCPLRAGKARAGAGGRPCSASRRVRRQAPAGAGGLPLYAVTVPRTSPGPAAGRVHALSPCGRVRARRCGNVKCFALRTFYLVQATRRAAQLARWQPRVAGAGFTALHRAAGAAPHGAHGAARPMRRPADARGWSVAHSGRLARPRRASRAL